MSEFRSDFGEQIMDLIDNALNSDNYDNLTKQINNLLNPQGQSGAGTQRKTQSTPQSSSPIWPGTGQNMTQQQRMSSYQARQQAAMEAANRGRASYDARRQAMSGSSATGQQFRAQRTAVRQPVKKVIFGNATGEGGAAVLMIFGGIVGISNAVNFLTALFSFSGGDMVAALLGAGVGAGMLGLGIGLNNRAKRFKKYVGFLKDKRYGSIKDLAALVGKSEEFVRKDLKRMIEKGWFPEGHLDDRETTMICTDELYEQYRRTQEQADRLRREKEELEAQYEQQYGGLSADIRAVLDKGDDYIEKIRNANEALPEKEISEKLDRLEIIISKIFARVKEAPEEAKNLSQFMDYYLPTTWKLVSAYQEMDAQPVQGENIQSAKREIKDSLDTINDAFETILDGMFKEQAWDVSTDISVMKSMMKQEGLTGSDFKAGKKNSVAQGAAAVLIEEE